MPGLFSMDDKCSVPTMVWGSVWLMSLITVVCVLLIITGAVSVRSPFENMPDYGIGQRGDVIASVPAYEEASLRQKVDEWTSQVNAPATTSQLTGTRDVPVFFQDYDVDMARKNARSAVGTSREGFEGGRNEDELERALAGRN